MPMIIFDILDVLLFVGLFLFLVTQIAVPLLFPEVFGPNLCWAVRRKTAANKKDHLRQQMAETQAEQELRLMRERLEKEKESYNPIPKPKRKRSKNPQTPKSTTPTGDSDGEPVSLS